MRRKTAVNEVLVYLELLRVQFSSEEEQVKADVRAVSESFRLAHNVALFAASALVASVICVVNLPTGVHLNFRLGVLSFGLAAVFVWALAWFDQQESTARKAISDYHATLARQRLNREAILRSLLDGLLH